MIIFLLIILLLLQITFNIVNSFIDAYLIFENKTIAHGVNLSCYAILVFLEIVYLDPNFVCAIIFCLNAFCNRQIFFDIPLNLRRGLSMYYMSLDKPPKAWWDRQEYKIFGSNGKAITLSYAAIWVITTIILFIL